ncbi:MFS transporter [Pyxidicoccus trucidator]|uniref:MFS transporter n=1 Tax=Pyxidicoccus trucidator TaxID=2709662 RepID=UPI0013D8FF21|nr:MFS transporter [Pyxidicoccus trucidator]
MAFIDELATGVVPSGAPELLSAFDLTPARAAGWTLFAFQVLGAVLEPPLLALAHGRRQRGMRAAGLAMMALTTLAAALAPSYWLLLAALALYGPASGLGVNLAQAALVSGNPERSEAVLARWTLLGLAGDLLAPLALAASVALGFGWRGALFAVAALAALEAAATLRTGGAGEAEEEEEPEGSLREALRTAVSCRPMLAWSAVVVLCGLMDEVLVAFGTLFLAGRLEATPTDRAAILSAWVVGGILGTALLERYASRFRPSTLLAVTGVGCTVAYAAWLAATTWLSSAVALGVAGVFASAHYPLLKARAFAALPGRPHLVLAMGSLLGWLDLALPLIVGAVADGPGLFAAMLVLLAQPVGVLLSALAARRGERRNPDARHTVLPED